jgi:hypothetical protein
MTDILRVLSDHPHIAIPLLILLMAAESAPLVGFFILGVLILPAVDAMTGTAAWPFLEQQRNVRDILTARLQEKEVMSGGELQTLFQELQQLLVTD